MPGHGSLLADTFDDLGTEELGLLQEGLVECRLYALGCGGEELADLTPGAELFHVDHQVPP